ncbi:MAG: cytochrome c, partial [Betaproteobacteria bacterium]
VIRPTNLVWHAAGHRPGELYWWIAHGRAGTAMPAFSPALESDDIWSVVQFLHALSDGADLGNANGQLIASPAPPAPDFSFELSGRGQQTLLQPAARRDTLLVLYRLPDSLARLRSLASERRAYEDRRIDVLAVAPSMAEAPAAGAQIPGGESILAVVAPDVAAAYAIFAARGAAAAPAGHVEFLIDRWGQLRARWLGAPGPSVDRRREIFELAAELDRESALAHSLHEHAH